MNLYFANLGFYPEDSLIRTEHHDFTFVIAPSLNSAKNQLKAMPAFKSKRMHIDSVILIDQVDNHQIQIVPRLDL